ncbi:N-acetylmuramoyl-L-alanine amidase [Gottfriedia acidiceleris]|uniref:peptidoglycan recognition protein family protein n=1 Tax=Gottfriedia acidiceleris TaxID=371036 RepID=UPI00197A7963|nr:N-acetylmuramoyl-L-alanine amidase [Gottfriedia acidiceleris]
MTAWKNDFVIKNKFSRPGLLLKGVKKIVLHWTGDPGATDEREQLFFDGADGGGSRYASAHLFVDSDSATCIIPLNEVAYHANDVWEIDEETNEPYRGIKEIAPNANYYSIGIEMCVEKDGTIAPETIERTVQVAAEICKTYKLTEKDIVRHYDVTHKPCPKPFIDDPSKFEDFKNQVGLILNPPNPEVKPVVVKPAPKPPVYPGGILQIGTKSSGVKLFQIKFGLKADGIFGPLTEKAVKDFQKKNKLTVDGKVGPKTWAKLFN